MGDKKCNDCSYTTSDLSQLNEHRKWIHDKVRDKKCGDCEYSTFLASNLAKHKKSVHDKIQDYVCKDCPFKTSAAALLKHHILRIHRSNRKIPCRYCPFTADSRTCLSNHLRVIHNKKRNISLNRSRKKMPRQLTPHPHKKDLLKMDILINETDLHDICCNRCAFSSISKRVVEYHIKDCH